MSESDLSSALMEGGQEDANAEVKEELVDASSRPRDVETGGDELLRHQSTTFSGQNTLRSTMSFDDTPGAANTKEFWCSKVVLTRIFKFFILSAGVATMDIIADIGTNISYWKSKLYLFGTTSLGILILNPFLIWIFLYNHKKADEWDLPGFLFGYKIWQEAYESVKTGKKGFTLAFVTMVEASGEAFPQGYLQQYSKLIGAVSPHGYLFWGIKMIWWFNFSIITGIISMAKTLTEMDFYGEEVPMLSPKFILRATFRLAEVTLRTTSLAYFGVLLRPKDQGVYTTLSNVAWHIPILFAVSFLANYGLIHVFVPKVTDLQMRIVWTYICILGTPPKFLSIFDPMRIPLLIWRFTELGIMAGSVHFFAIHPEERFVGIMSLMLKCSLPVLLLSAFVACLSGDNYFPCRTGATATVYRELHKVAVEETAGGQPQGAHNGALVTAVKEQDEIMLDILASYMDVNVPGEDGRFVIEEAREKNVVQMLFKKGVIPTSDECTKSLARAITAGDHKLIECFCNEDVKLANVEEGNHALKKVVDNLIENAFAKYGKEPWPEQLRGDKLTKDVINTLSKAGANMKSKSTKEALLSYIKKGSLERIEAFTECGTVLTNETHRNTAVETFARGSAAPLTADAVNVLKLLKRAGAVLDSSSARKILAKDLGLIQAFVESGANLDSKDEENNNALAYAENYEAVDKFAKSGIDMKSVESQRALHIAIRKGNLEMMKTYMKYGTTLSENDRGVAMTSFSESGVPLTPEATELLADLGADTSGDGAAKLLLDCIKKGQGDAAAALESRGAKLKNDTDKNDAVKLFFLGCRTGKDFTKDDVKILSRAGANLNSSATRQVMVQRCDLIQSFVEEGANLNTSDEAGNHVLIYATKDDSTPEALEALAKAGVDMTSEESRGELNNVIGKGREDLMEVFIKSNTELLSKDKAGVFETFFHSGKNLAPKAIDLMALAVRSSKDFQAASYEHLLRAIQHQDLPIVEAFAKNKVQLNKGDQNKVWDAFLSIEAREETLSKVITVASEMGVDTRLKLMEFVKKGEIPMMKMFADAGVTLNATKMASTALDLFIKKMPETRVEHVKILKQIGVNLTNPTAQKTLWEALTVGNVDLMEALVVEGKTKLPKEHAPDALEKFTETARNGFNEKSVCILFQAGADIKSSNTQAFLKKQTENPNPLSLNFKIDERWLISLIKGAEAAKAANEFNICGLYVFGGKLDFTQKEKTLVTAVLKAVGKLGKVYDITIKDLQGFRSDEDIKTLLGCLPKEKLENLSLSIKGVPEVTDASAGHIVHWLDKCALKNIELDCWRMDKFTSGSVGKIVEKLNIPTLTSCKLIFGNTGFKDDNMTQLHAALPPTLKKLYLDIQRTRVSKVGFNALMSRLPRDLYELSLDITDTKISIDNPVGLVGNFPAEMHVLKLPPKVPAFEPLRVAARDKGIFCCEIGTDNPLVCQ